MKPALFLLLINLLFTVHAIGQQPNFSDNSVVSVSENFQNGLASARLSSALSSPRRYRRPRNPKTKAGAIIAITGGGVVFVNGIVMALVVPGGEDGPIHQSKLNLGLGIMAAGAVMVITGSILARIGHNEDRHKYGWQIVAPKSNEIGFALNF